MDNFNIYSVSHIKIFFYVAKLSRMWLFSSHISIDTAQKPCRFFLVMFFFSVTETNETVKIYKENSKMN